MSAFVSLPLLSAVVPLAIVPILVRSLGATGWASIAVGMSVGAAGAILVNWGWGLVGPAEVAKLTSLQASRVYSVSFLMRLALALPVSVAVFLSADALDQSAVGSTAGIMAVATALSGLSPAWFFVGVGRAAGIAIWDTAPRILSAAISVPVLLTLADGTWYAVINLVICGGAWLLAGFVIGRSGRRDGPIAYWRLGLASLRDQASITFSGIISGGYTSLTVAIVGAVNFSAVAPFAAGDRFRAMGKQGEMAVTNGLQAWIGSSTGLVQRKRMISSLTFMSATGFVAGSLFAFGMPVIAPILLGPAVTVDALTCVFMGVALFMTGVSLSTSLHILAPLRRRHTISLATTIGAFVGVPVVAFGAASFGSAGASAGLALAELTVAAVQVPVSLHLLSRMNAEANPSNSNSTLMR